MNIKPLSDHVVVKPVDQAEKTQSGIIIPDTAKENRRKAKSLQLGRAKSMIQGRGFLWKSERGIRCCMENMPARK